MKLFKKIIELALLSVLLVVPFIRSSVTFAETEIVEHPMVKADTVVTIPDQNLFEGLKNILGLPFAEELTVADLEKLELADISYGYGHDAVPGPVADLTGLEYAVNLKKIHFSGDTITNLAPISQLPNLNIMIGTNTSLTDISTIGGLVQLEEIEFGGDYITDFSVLQTLPHLKKFSYNSQTWQNPNFSEIKEIQMFNTMQSLEELDLTWNQVADLTPLKGNDYITKLNLTHNQLTDLSPLVEMKNLSVLYLNQNGLISLAELGQLKGLSILYADDNQIRDLSQLNQLFDSMVVVGDYKGLQVNNQTITLPAISVKSGQTVTTENPTKDLTGTQMPITTISDGGVAEVGNQSVSWTNRTQGMDVNFKVQYTTQSNRGVPLSYSAKVIQPIVVLPDTDSIVTVKYVDMDNQEIAPAETLTGTIGTTYASEAKVIQDYELTQTPANAIGQFTAENQTVTYQYDRLDGAPVQVKYLDIEGNELAPTETLTGKIGKAYTSEAKHFSDYQLMKTPNNANGIFDTLEQTVIYQYDIVDGAPVTVKYVNQNGKELASSETLTGKLHTFYTTELKAINGYTNTTIIGNQTGVFTKDKQVITYVYEKDLFPVIPPVQPAEPTTPLKPAEPNEVQKKVTKTVEDKKQLPTTGDKIMPEIKVAGGILLLGSFLFYLSKKSINKVE